MIRTGTLLDFKASPAYVLPSLQVIRRFQGDWYRIRSELVRSIRALDSEANEEIIVSAYVTPTLRNLSLADGIRETFRLLPDGKQCLQSYDRRRLPGYLTRLGLQLINVDESTARLIPFLLENHDSARTAATISEIAAELQDLGFRGLERSTRLRGWMDFLDYVYLTRTHRGRLYILRTQYEVFKRGEKRPSMREYADALKSSYDVSRFRTYGSPYVPIPDLREQTCGKLGITSFTFDEYLTKLVRIQAPIQLVLATPTEKVRGGITFSGKYYYLLALYHKR